MSNSEGDDRIDFLADDYGESVADKDHPHCGMDFFAAASLAVLYSGITNNITAYTWIASGLVAAEGLVLLAFQSHCLSMFVARKYSTSTKDNFRCLSPGVAGAV